MLSIFHKFPLRCDNRDVVIALFLVSLKVLVSTHHLLVEVFVSLDILQFVYKTIRYHREGLP